MDPPHLKMITIGRFDDIIRVSDDYVYIVRLMTELVFTIGRI